MSSPDGLHIVVGYDGSIAASAAIDAGARLAPQARASVVTLWTPPFFSDDLRKRLWDGTRDIEAFQAAVEREGGREAGQIAAAGASLARAAGWTAESRTKRSLGGEGLKFAQVADQAGAVVSLGADRFTEHGVWIAGAIGMGNQRKTEVGGPSGLRKTIADGNSLAHRTTWLRSDLGATSNRFSGSLTRPARL